MVVHEDMAAENIEIYSQISNCSLQWRHNERDGVWSHRRLYCLLNRLFRRRSKKASKLHVTGTGDRGIPLTKGPHKGPVTRKMFPFDDGIIMYVVHEGMEAENVLRYIPGDPIEMSKHNIG